MKLPLLGFICINYNNAKFTLDFCESLNEQLEIEKSFDLKCIVVDNSAHSLDSKLLIDALQKFHFVDYLAADKNLGYFGGLNIGLDKLRLEVYDYVVLCNNDLKFENDFCQKLILKNYRSDVFAVCPNVITSDGLHQNPHFKKRIGWLRRAQFDIYFSHYFIASALMAILKAIRPKKRNSGTSSVEQEIHMGIGACYILLKPFMKRFRRLDYPFFLYGEEAFFSNQVHLGKGILWFDPTLTVHHEESATLSKIPKKSAYKFAREGYSTYRNMI